MKQEIKPKECRNPDCDRTFTPRKSTDKFCSPKCAKPFFKPPKRTPIQSDPKPIKRKRTTRIKPMSDKRKKLVARYMKIKLEFMAKPENKICPVALEGREGEKRPTTDIHHMMGRGLGYADEWAEQHDIPLLLDKRFFLAVSRIGHRWIEENPEKAKERGFSLNRL